MKKWIILFSGVILQTILGGIYAWSEFAVPLVEDYGLTRQQTGQIFGLTIAVFALSMNPAARLLHRFGPRLTASLGVFLYTCGYFLASRADGNFSLLLVSFGILMGSGIGFGYVCPLTVNMKWFPEKKGLVTGIAVGGFGAGAILISNLAQYLMHHHGYNLSQIFMFLALYPGAIAMLAVQTFSSPSDCSTKIKEQKKISFKSTLLSPEFLLILLGMFSGTFAGLLIIGNLKPMMLAAGLEEAIATLCISVFAAGNITGRVLWGQISDRLSPWKTILAAKLIFIFAITLLMMTGSDSALVLVACFSVGLGFGSCFVIYAAAVADLYGVKLFGKLYPLVFAAYGLAALTGPQTGGWLADFSGSYIWGMATGTTLIIISGFLVLLVTCPEILESLKFRLINVRRRLVSN